MKRMILVAGALTGALAAAIGTVNAADMPVKARPMAVAAAYDWTGFYIGGHAGGLWERSSFGESARDVLFPGFVTLGGFPGPVPLVIVPSRFGVIPASIADGSGAIVGGQAGYNRQFNKFVLGVEADASWTNARSTALVSPVDPFAVVTLNGRFATNIDWTASLRGRAGVSFDRLLVYATGGVAFIGGNVASSFTLNNPIGGIFFPVPASGTTFANSGFTGTGWTVGAGIEWAFTDKWSLAGEYRYSDFGSRTVTLANTDPAAAVNGLGIVAQTVNVRVTTEQATLRLNYRFGAPAVVAKY